MNILQVTPRIPAPPNDGGAVYIYNTTKHLHQLGHQIQIASLISNKHPQDIKELSEFGKVYATEGGFSGYSILAALKSFITFKPITISHRMDRSRMLESLNQVTTTPDIILLEGLHTAEFLDDIREKFPGTPVVLRQSNVEYLLFKRNGQKSSSIFLKCFYLIQSQLMKHYEINALKKADAVTAITGFDKNIFTNHLPDLNCFISPAGADIPQSINLSDQRKDHLMLAISNWRWKPNYDGLVWFLNEVWPSLSIKHPKLRFEIIGEGLTEDFQKQYKHPNIQFRGFVNDIDPIRASATFFIAPLFSGSGMKLKVVEGMAFGLPIVTTEIGAEGINIEDGTHYLQANSAGDFSDKISLLLEDKNLRDHLSNNAVQVVREEYSWKSITRNLTKFLNEVTRQYKSAKQPLKP